MFAFPIYQNIEYHAMIYIHWMTQTLCGL